MPNENLQEHRNQARICNAHILLNIGFRRVGNSSLFKKGKSHYIISPGISKGKHEKYWFDIRQANLNKIGEGSESWVLLRIVPSWFGLFPMKSIHQYLSNPLTSEFRRNSGKVWGFYCDLDEEEGTITITSKNDDSVFFKTELLDMGKASNLLAGTIKS